MTPMDKRGGLNGSVQTASGEVSIPRHQAIGLVRKNSGETGEHTTGTLYAPVEGDDSLKQMVSRWLCTRQSCLKDL